MLIDEKVMELNGEIVRRTTYSVDEVCKMLAVERKTVYMHIKQKFFKAIKVERTYRIDCASFDEWLDGK